MYPPVSFVQKIEMIVKPACGNTWIRILIGNGAYCQIVNQ